VTRGIRQLLTCGTWILAFGVGLLIGAGRYPLQVLGILDEVRT